MTRSARYDTVARSWTDVEVGDPELLLEVLQQGDHLRPDRHVERRHRLVEDEHLRVDRECLGDRDPLPLSPAELVGVEPTHLRAHADEVEHVVDPFGHLVGGHVGVDFQALGDDVANPHPGAQRRERVLEDGLDPSTVGEQLLAPETADLRAAEPDRTLGGVFEAQEELGDRRLATARLANEAERLAFGDVEADVVDRPDPLLPPTEAQNVPPRREVLLEVANLQDRVGRAVARAVVRGGRIGFDRGVGGSHRPVNAPRP